MHSLDVIVAKNTHAARREAAHAWAEGDRAKRDRILDANPDLDTAESWCAVADIYEQEG